MRLQLLPQVTLAAAGTFTSAKPLKGLGDLTYLLGYAKFDYVSGTTPTVKAYVQTSLDDGATWIDIMCFSFTTTDANKMHKTSSNAALTPATVPSDGALTADTILDGVLGDQFRVKYVVTGTYTGATKLEVWGEGK